MHTSLRVYSQSSFTSSKSKMKVPYDFVRKYFLLTLKRTHIISWCFHCWIRTCKYRFRSSLPEVFLGKGVLKICIKFTREHLRRSVISKSNFTEITLRYGCSSVDLLHIFRTPYKNTSGGLLLPVVLIFRKKQLMWQKSICILDQAIFL